MFSLTHWGRVTHICVGKLSIIGSDNGLSPSRRQAIIWTNAGILLIGTLATNFSEISIEIYTFSFKKMHLNMSSGKWRPCCVGLNVLRSHRGSYLLLYYHRCVLWSEDTLQWRHKSGIGVSNYWQLECVWNFILWLTSKNIYESSALLSTLCESWITINRALVNTFR